MVDSITLGFAAISRDEALWSSGAVPSGRSELAGTAAEAIYALRHSVGWPPLHARLLAYLAEDEAEAWWGPARTALWLGSRDGLETSDSSEVRALLRHRFPDEDEDEGEGIASIGPSAIAPHALDDALVMWRQTRHPDLARVVRALAAELGPGEEVPGWANARAHTAWLAVARSGPPVRVNALLESLVSGHVTHAHARLAALYDRGPDPRVTHAVREWCLAGHFRNHPVEHPWWRMVETVLTEWSAPSFDFGRLADEVHHATGQRVGRHRRAISEFIRGMTSSAPSPTPLTSVRRARLDAWRRRFEPDTAPPEARSAPDVERLWRDVVAAPDDDAARSVLADRWQELGDARGEFVGLQLARAARYPHADLSSGSVGRLPAPEQQLLTEYGATWFGEGFVELTKGYPRRGFPTFAELRGTLRNLSRMVGNPGLATVRKLFVSNARLQAPQSDWFDLLRHDYARNLQEVRLPVDALVGLPSFTCSPARVFVPYGWLHARIPPEALVEPLATAEQLCIEQLPSLDVLKRFPNRVIRIDDATLQDVHAVRDAVASTVQTLDYGSLVLKRDARGGLVPTLGLSAGQRTGRINLAMLGQFERPPRLTLAAGVHYDVQPHHVDLLAALPPGPVRLMGWSIDALEGLPPVPEVVNAHMSLVAPLSSVAQVERLRWVDEIGDQLLLQRGDDGQFRVAHLWGGHMLSGSLHRILKHVWPHLSEFYWGGPRRWTRSLVEKLPRRGGLVFEERAYPAMSLPLHHDAYRT
ncbi:MAG: hypothetical protein AAF211_10995 [Myxococcota bacterium]